MTKTNEPNTETVKVVTEIVKQLFGTFQVVEERENYTLIANKLISNEWEVAHILGAIRQTLEGEVVDYTSDGLPTFTPPKSETIENGIEEESVEYVVDEDEEVPEIKIEIEEEEEKIISIPSTDVKTEIIVEEEEPEIEDKVEEEQPPTPEVEESVPISIEDTSDLSAVFEELRDLYGDDANECIKEFLLFSEHTKGFSDDAQFKEFLEVFVDFAKNGLYGIVSSWKGAKRSIISAAAFGALKKVLKTRKPTQREYLSPLGVNHRSLIRSFVKVKDAGLNW